MPELSLQTINIIAYSKILLLVTILAVIFLSRYQRKPWLFSLLASTSVAGLYLIISWPLQTMWWGNNGDEIFIMSFLSQVLLGNPLNDFFYHGLPNFYPPLYFWTTGLISRLFAEHAISAAKFGVAATVFLWFIGAYLWQKIYWDYIKDGSRKLLASRPWFWFAAPLILFFLIDFNDIILKPYETLPALTLALMIGMIADAFSESEWNYKHYLFFGISGGLLFLSYYFWWFMMIPALFTVALLSARKKTNVFRVIGVGAIMFVLASVYLVPLFLSYLGGMENWQALFFVPKDFSTFLPFAELSWKTPLILAGIAGLILYHKKPFVRANIILLLFGFVYQFVSIFLYVSGGNPVQAAKAFLFLGTASITVGCVYLLVGGWHRYAAPLSQEKQGMIIAGLIVFSLPFWPMTVFMDDPVVRQQIEKDLTAPSAAYLAPSIKQHVPDWKDRTWLSSGIPDINAYLPLHYFIAYNPHFSHHAAKYSERMEVIGAMADANSSKFRRRINDTPIDALLLYKQYDEESYPFFFWADNYPNGGKEKTLEVDKDNFDDLNWQKRYEDAEWVIYTK